MGGTSGPGGCLGKGGGGGKYLFRGRNSHQANWPRGVVKREREAKD